MAFKILNSTIIDDTRNIINAAAVGIGTTNPTSKLWVDGDGYFTGISTASQFVSNVAQGNAPISVASSTLVTNLNAQYLNGQSGAYYNSANNLTGTAPGSVISQSNGLTVTGNLNVSGNVSVAGSSFILNAQQLRITDRDITLGVTTDASGNDISNDTTANHGGIAIASTEGSPILNIPIQAGINTDPSTYKQLMWIKQGNYSGMGTDAWVFNYAVSIGNTASVQNLSRLTVGAGFTVFDTYLDATDIRARNITAVTNINATGIVTAAGGFNASSSSDYEINGTSVLNSTTLGSAVVNSSLTSVGTLGKLVVTGVTTSGGVNVTTGNSYQINGTSVLNATTLGSAVVNSSLTSVGILPTLNATNITNTNINSGGIHTAGSYYVGATKVLDTVSSQVSLVGIATLDATTKATLERELAFAPNEFNSLNVSGISTLQTTTIIGGGTSTGTSGQVLQVTGISSGAYIGGSVGIGTTNPKSKLHVVGDVLVSGVTTSGGVVVTTGNDYKIGTTSVLTSTTLGSAVVNSSLTSVGILGRVNVSGISTLQSTTLIGGGTSTGTAGQVLQVTGISSGAYIGGSLGIAITNPAQPLDVNGNVRFRAALVDNNGVTGAASSVLTAGTGGQLVWAPIVSGGGAAIAGISVTQDDTGIRYPLLASGANATTTAQYVDATALVYNTSSNCLGIGSLTPTSKLDIIGDVRVSGIVTAGDFNSSSDRKLKTNIQTIANPIEKVLQINGVNFNWKESGKATMGVIAQEVEAVLPELVSDTDPKSVNYNGLIGLLIECVKDQQRQIDELRNIT